MRRPLRILGTLLIAAGVLTLAWTLVVWQWQDPFTALYTKWQQHQLSSQYDKRIQSFDGSISGASISAERASVAVAAKNYRRTSKRGQALGRIQHSADGHQHGPRERHGSRHVEERPRPRRAHVHARREPAHLHRRPPHDVPRAVLAHRQAPGGRPRHDRGSLCDVRVRRDPSPDRRSDRPRPCFARRDTSCSSCRRVIRGSLQRTGTSRTHASCVSSRAARRPTSSRLRPAASSARSRPRRARRLRVAQARARRRLPNARSCGTPGP